MLARLHPRATHRSNNMPRWGGCAVLLTGLCATATLMRDYSPATLETLSNCCTNGVTPISITSVRMAG
jgi:hypothetical protein